MVYIDAFAGSGAFRYVPDDTGTGLLFEMDETSEHAGSAQRALRLNPAFDEVVFIEKRASNVAALRDLIAASQHRAAAVERGDANQILKNLCDPARWRGRRGVIFLDPFGMEVEWKTLELVAKTKALDLWYLFPLAGSARCLPLNAARLDQSKRNAMTRVLGTDQWYDAFYRPVEHREQQLWNDAAAPALVRRNQGLDDIERFVAERLRTVFPNVAPAKRLHGPRNQQLFSLFFAVSNPNPKAIMLARKGADHILKV